MTGDADRYFSLILLKRAPDFPLQPGMAQKENLPFLR